MNVCNFISVNAGEFQPFKAKAPKAPTLHRKKKRAAQCLETKPTIKRKKDTPVCGYVHVDVRDLYEGIDQVDEVQVDNPCLFFLTFAYAFMHHS